MPPLKKRGVSSSVAQAWLKYGSSMATDTSKRDLTGCAAGSNLLDGGSKSNLMFLKCGSIKHSVWLKCGSSTAQVSLKCGSSLVWAQVWLTYDSRISKYR